MNHEHIEIAAASSKVMYGSAGATVVFGLSASEIGAYCAMFSAFIALCGLGVTVYFKWQDHKLKKKALQDGKPNKVFGD